MVRLIRLILAMAVLAVFSIFSTSVIAAEAPSPATTSDGGSATPSFAAGLAVAVAAIFF
ncbi:hypothetical protein RND81_08G195900 [Saponaria officinalis]|uniref:Uncharacterized protein n=1 Tax=Saponaria officinalis TaxID=3572 RepID=A0AAW1J9W3_SAPOF